VTRRRQRFTCGHFCVLVRRRVQQYLVVQVDQSITIKASATLLCNQETETDFRIFIGSYSASWPFAQILQILIPPSSALSPKVHSPHTSLYNLTSVFWFGLVPSWSPPSSCNPRSGLNTPRRPALDLFNLEYGIRNAFLQT
jgi:hypothetical protein